MDLAYIEKLISEGKALEVFKDESGLIHAQVGTRGLIGNRTRAHALGKDIVDVLVRLDHFIKVNP